MRNITLSADEQLIEVARTKAQQKKDNAKCGIS